MNWNILAGGGSRVPGIASHIRSHNPDLCVLTEYRRGDSGEALKAALARHGFHHVIEPPSERAKNSAAIFSQVKLDPPSISVDIPEGLQSYLVLTEYHGTCIIGVFCAVPKVAIELLTFLKALSSRYPEQSFLIVGDFFFGPRLSDLNFGRPLRTLSDNGWIGAWDTLHPAEECWSCQTGRGKSRPDDFFLFGSDAPRVQQVDAFTEALAERLSDHAPMIVRFQSCPPAGAIPGAVL